MKPIISICTITYNHEKFIAQAIESFLSQITSFDFEIIIGDDNSSDNTAAIVESYQAKYPDKIIFLRHPQNLGMMRNFEQVYHRCRGKYIAMCEGDDYWIDQHKLQKQVTFLEKNQDFSICFHRARLVYENNISHFYRDINQSTPEVTTLHDIVLGNYIHTPTCVFKKQAVDFPNWFWTVPTGDWALHILHAEYGKIYFMKEEMAAYRIHHGGVLSTKKAGGPQDIRKMEMYLHLANHFKAKDSTIYKWFYELHYHQKAVYYGIQNAAEKNVFQRFGILISSAFKVKKPKLLLAAFLLPFFPGDSLNNLWTKASQKRGQLAVQ